jgi:hypothetical protein
VSQDGGEKHLARNALYYCRVKVSRTPGSGIPEEYAGAYVPAFAAAEDHQKALGLIIPALIAMGWTFEELENHRVDEMDAELWDDFVDATWPEHKNQLPDKEDVEALLGTGGSFHGPFSVWASTNEQEDRGFP